VQQVADFPATEHDDLTDTVSQALRKVRKGGMVELPMDLKVKADDDGWQYPKNGYY
jgi:hypothetical protein